MRRPSAALFYNRPLSKAKSIAAPSATPAPSAADENTSPARSPLVPNLKEARAWEHDRQRLKKASGFVKNQARKAQADTRGQSPTLAAKPYDRRPAIRAAVDQLEGDVPDLACEESEVDWDDAASPVRSLCLDRDEEGEKEGVPRVSSRHEVPLTDLLVSRKPRHGREADFEVVPPVRSVIVLDDKTTPDLDFNDPWEHVYAEDATEQHTHERVPSYAKIAALN
ncbi:hypothetical protein LshimejAT787_1401350 [Lyophyllum shimeji]|uniref:Uncharacterized protein n=1 Tax=Lyophyllum shimeji TaxID=47721 RepID=A0A9P3PXY8_LYOSH|nr:hypothetical protein LshimejAT787_1401350 [Lyophyllum shimeji]